MTFQGPTLAMPAPQIISPLASCAMSDMMQTSGGAGLQAAGGTWPSANRAFAYPIRLEEATPIKRAWVFNGGGTIQGNMDIGIYTAGFSKIWSSGSTARTGQSTMQLFTPSPDPLIIGPGLFYVAVSLSTTAGNQVVHQIYTQRFLQMGGIVQMDSALPLPTTFTPAALTTGDHFMFGLSTVTTV